MVNILSQTRTNKDRRKVVDQRHTVLYQDLDERQWGNGCMYRHGIYSAVERHNLKDTDHTSANYQSVPDAGSSVPTIHKTINGTHGCVCSRRARHRVQNGSMLRLHVRGHVTARSKTGEFTWVSENWSETELTRPLPVQPKFRGVSQVLCETERRDRETHVCVCLLVVR